MLTENDFDGYIPAHNTVGARCAHNMRTEANYHRQRGIENQAIVISPKTTHPPTTNWAGFVF
jgi:hypothetical protein